MTLVTLSSCTHACTQVHTRHAHTHPRTPHPPHPPHPPLRPLQQPPHRFHDLYTATHRPPCLATLCGRACMQRMLKSSDHKHARGRPARWGRLADTDTHTLALVEVKGAHMSARHKFVHRTCGAHTYHPLTGHEMHVYHLGGRGHPLPQLHTDKHKVHAHGLFYGGMAIYGHKLSYITAWSTRADVTGQRFMPLICAKAGAPTRQKSDCLSSFVSLVQVDPHTCVGRQVKVTYTVIGRLNAVTAGALDREAEIWTVSVELHRCARGQVQLCLVHCKHKAPTVTRSCKTEAQPYCYQLLHRHV